MRQAANVVGNLKDTALSNFFRRIAFRKGRTSAISATARKLAVIIWNMITKKVSYKTDNRYEFLDQKRKRKVLEAKITSLQEEFESVTDELNKSYIEEDLKKEILEKNRQQMTQKRLTQNATNGKGSKERQ